MAGLLTNSPGGFLAKHDQQKGCAIAFTVESIFAAVATRVAARVRLLSTTALVSRINPKYVARKDSLAIML